MVMSSRHGNPAFAQTSHIGYLRQQPESFGNSQTPAAVYTTLKTYDLQPARRNDDATVVRLYAADHWDELC